MYLLNNRRKWFERRRPEGAAIPMSECVVTVDTPVQYTGIALYPAVVVKYGDDVLVRDVDYALTYKDNVNLGNGTVTVTGIGAFTGRAVKTFTVKDVGGGGGGAWDFNIADATFVEKVRPSSSYYQSTRIIGSAFSSETPGRMFLFIANFLSGRFVSIYGLDQDEYGEYHLSGMTQELSHGSPSYSSYYGAKVVSRDGLSISWVNPNDNGVIAQTTMSAFADLSSQTEAGLSAPIPRSVAILGSSSSNIAYIDSGRKVAVFCQKEGAGSGVFVVKFDLSTPYDMSTIDVDSEDSAKLPFGLSYSDAGGILVSDDGMNVLFSTDLTIRQYKMSRAFDFSSIEEVGSLRLSGSAAHGYAMSPDKKTLFFATSDGYVHEYALNR